MSVFQQLMMKDEELKAEIERLKQGLSDNLITVPQSTTSYVYPAIKYRVHVRVDETEYSFEAETLDGVLELHRRWNEHRRGKPE